MKHIRALLVSLIAMLLVGVTALSASAYTLNGRIYNNSSGNIAISEFNPYKNGRTLPPGHMSTEYITNVQCFWSNRDLRSQWGGLYPKGVIRCMSKDGVYLQLSNA